MCRDLAQALPLSQEAVLIALFFLPLGKGGFSPIPTPLVPCTENSLGFVYPIQVWAEHVGDQAG